MAAMRYTEVRDTEPDAGATGGFRRGDIMTKSLRTPTKSVSVVRSPSDCGKKSSAPTILVGPPPSYYDNVG